MARSSSMIAPRMRAIA